jgi:hypothetical protein
MKKKIIIFLITLFSFSLINSQVNNQFIKAEFDRLLLISQPNFPVKLEIVEKGEMIAIRDQRKIIFAVNQYDKFSEGLSDNGKKFLIQILLAHELSHQFQFNWFKDEIELIEKPVFRMVLEAQADLLAGFSFGNLLAYDVSKKNISESDFSTKDLYDLFEVILDMGISENSIGTHPSRNDRLMSIKHGFAFGMSYYAINNAKNNPELIKSYYGSLEAYDKIVKESYNLLDYSYSSENPFLWCFKLAKRIINYDSDIAKKIMLIRPNGGYKIDWKTTQDNPIVNYDFDYINTSDKTIIAEMEVYVSHILKLSKQNTVYHTRRNSRLHKVIFRPHEIISLKGTLHWDELFGDDSDITSLFEDKIPKLIFPHAGAIESWMSCRYLDQVDSFEKSESIMNYLTLEGKLDNSPFRLAANTIKLLRYLNSDYEKLITGIADFYSYDIKGASFVEYACPIYFDKNAVVKTTLYYPDDDIFRKPISNKIDIFIKYDLFDLESEALEKFNYLISSFDKALVGYTKAENFEVKNEKLVSYEGSENSVDLSLHYDLQLNGWIIDIELYKI